MYKKLLFAVSFIFVLWLIVNIPYLKVSVDVHKMVSTGNYDNEIVAEYIKETASTRVRGCTLSAKIISLSCSESVSSWALGETMSNAINEKISE